MTGHGLFGLKCWGVQSSPSSVPGTCAQGSAATAHGAEARGRHGQCPGDSSDLKPGGVRTVETVLEHRGDPELQGLCPWPSVALKQELCVYRGPISFRVLVGHRCAGNCPPRSKLLPGGGFRRPATPPQASCCRRCSFMALLLLTRGVCPLDEQQSHT